MGKRINIVIAETSAIVRCGIVTLLQRAAMSHAEILELVDPSQVLSGLCRPVPDILIVNPSYMGAFSPEKVKSNIGNENVKIIALQSAFVEQSILHNYDDVISIYDNIDAIRDKIINVVKEAEDQETKKELSAREKEIIVLVVKGMTNKQIADTLCLSAHTVIAHRRNIANKLQIHSPSGLTIYAIVNKLVDLADIKNTISQTNSDEI